MGFLDFITKPRFEATPGDQMEVSPYEQPQAQPNDGLLSAVPEALEMGAPQQMQGAPTLEEQPSLLSGVWDYLKSPQNLAALGGALKNYSGGEGGVEQAMAIGDRRRHDEQRNEAEEKAKADLAKKNAAFKAAYQGGRFDPQAYMAAIGDGGDAAEGFSLAAKLAPKGGVDGGTAYTEDPITGEIVWGEQRGMSPAEKLAEQRAQQLEEYRRQQLEDADERIALARQREGRVAAGPRRGGGGGGSHGPQTHGAGLNAIEAELRNRGLIP